jgi:transposase
VTDAALPLSFVITGGNINDCTRLVQVIEARGSFHQQDPRLPAPTSNPAHRRRTPGPTRHPERRGWHRCGFDKQMHRRRNVVERCFNQLKRFRGLATRYEKLAAHHRSVVTIATLILWLNQDPRTRP